MSSDREVGGNVLKPGELAGGKYRVEELIGAGGMGVVHAATHIHLGTRVAIKVMAERAVRAEGTVRLLREARVVARMSSPHVVRVLDMGTLLDDSPFLVMELLDGEDLGAVLARRGPLPIREALCYVIQACDAVAEAHGLGVIHRDIKPSNLYVTRDGCVKVVDFGLAKLRDGELCEGSDFSFTRSDALLGSPLYMAPEQAASPRTVDARADVWGLGATLWQLLTGAPVFQAESLASLVVKTATAELPDLCALRPDVSPALRALLAHCLEKDRERRLAAASLLGARLSVLLEAASTPAEENPSRQKDELLPVAVPMRRSKSGRKSARLRAGGWLLVSAAAAMIALPAQRELAPGVARAVKEQVVAPRPRLSEPLPASVPAAPLAPTRESEERKGVGAVPNVSRKARAAPGRQLAAAAPATAAGTNGLSGPTHYLPGLFDRK